MLLTGCYRIDYTFLLLKIMRSVKDSFTRSDWYLVGSDENRRLEIFMADNEELSARFKEIDFIGQQSRVISTTVRDQIELVSEYFKGEADLKDVIIFSEDVSKVMEKISDNVNCYLKTQKEQGLESSVPMEEFLKEVKSFMNTNMQVISLVENQEVMKAKLDSEASVGKSIEKQKPTFPSP